MPLRQRARVVLACIVLVTASTVVSGPAVAATAKPFVGTLVTSPDHAPTESRAGVKVAMLEVHWNYFEPTREVVNQQYAANMLSIFRRLRDSGMRVTLGLGLHFTPSWVLATRTNHLKDEHGTVSPQADVVFNRYVRGAVEWYLRQLNRYIPLKYFWGARITSGGGSELLYPTTSFWAASVGATVGSYRADTLDPNPYPGKDPAELRSAASRRTWAHWYIGALADVADWQMDYLMRLGFNGYYQLVMPGQGLRPSQWDDLMSAGLREGTLGRGAVWHVLLAHLARRKSVTVYVSSVADGTADDSVCTSSDSAVALDDPQIFLWSGTRWMSYLARRFGMTVAGEPPGYPDGAADRKHYVDRTSRGLLAIAMRQAASCGFLGLYWAHDAQVIDGTMPLQTLAAYSSASAEAPPYAS